MRRSRGHHVLRPPEAPQHLRLRVGGKTRRPRTLLQRGRPRRLRRASYDIDVNVLARPVVDRREHAHHDEDPRVRADHDDAAAGGIARRARRVLAGIRPAAAPARRRSEQPDRQPAGAGLPRQRVVADHRLWRPRRAAGARTRGDRRHRAGSGARRRSHSSRATSTATARYWYPQSTVTDYATARLRVYGAERVRRDRERPRHDRPSTPPAGPSRRRSATKDVRLPVRSAGALSRVRDQPVLDDRERAVERAVDRDAMPLRQSMADADPDEAKAGPAVDRATRRPSPSSSRRTRARRRARVRCRRSRRTIFQFYASLVGEAPYPSFTLAVTESELPGRPQPGVLCRPQSAAADVAARVAQRSGRLRELSRRSSSRTSSRISGGDRRSAGRTTTSSGSAKGSRSTSPRCTREKERGTGNVRGPPAADAALGDRGVRPGPVYLGYRLGHIKGDSRVFRALVYNKGAMVLHMLRRLVGDEAFFTGVRRFYGEWRFAKAGTDDFRARDGSGQQPRSGAVLRGLDLRVIDPAR